MSGCLHRYVPLRHCLELRVSSHVSALACSTFVHMRLEFWEYEGSNNSSLVRKIRGTSDKKLFDSLTCKGSFPRFASCANCQTLPPVDFRQLSRLFCRTVLSEEGTRTITRMTYGCTPGVAGGPTVPRSKKNASLYPRSKTGRPYNAAAFVCELL